MEIVELVLESDRDELEEIENVDESESRRNFLVEFVGIVVSVGIGFLVNVIKCGNRWQTTCMPPRMQLTSIYEINLIKIHRGLLFIKFSTSHRGLFHIWTNKQVLCTTFAVW